MQNEAKSPSNGDKEVAFYSAVVQAWVETRMQRDRSILALSSGAIGLLVTLLTAVGVIAFWQVALYILAAVLFCAAIIIAVSIFSINANYLEKVATSGHRGDDPKLVHLDTALLICFVLGVIVLSFLGILTAWIQMSPRGG